MAVKFKVPASPKRNVFEIDDFLGVDLSNIGTNIDVRRSPNAENMVRWTPGKVRKRTGYKTQILFSTIDDINRVKNTSDEWLDLQFDTYNISQVFETYQELTPTFWLCVEVEAVGNYTFGNYVPISHWVNGVEFNGTLQHPYVGVVSLTNGHGTLGSQLAIRRTSYNNYDYCKIRCLRACISTKATSVQEWEALPWKPAPEDFGAVIVDSDSEPVHGCHIFRNGGTDRNEVVNINRALDSSNIWQTYTVTQEEETEVCKLAEKIYKDNNQYPQGITVYVEFDYISDGEVLLYIRNAEFNGDIENNVLIETLQDTDGEAVHVKKSLTAGITHYDYSVKLYSEDGNAEVQIKNFSLVYDKDEDFIWSPAPEDTDETFNLANIYNVDKRNRAWRDSYSNTRQTSYGMAELSTEVAGSAIQGKFCKVSFDLTAVSENVEEIDVFLSDNVGNNCQNIDIATENIQDKHYEVYTSAENLSNFIRKINVWFYCEYESVEDVYDASISISNIQIYTITPKTEYITSNMTRIYHVGKNFFIRKGNNLAFDLAYENAKRRRSVSYQIDNMLIILDGKNIYKYTEADGLKLASESAYIPLVTIGKSPDGGGYAYEPLNMLQPGFYEQFTVDSAHQETTRFYLSFDNLDSTEVVVWKLFPSGNWHKMTEDRDFTVNRRHGYLIFLHAPGVTPVTGEDNIKVLAYKTVRGYRRRVSECTFGVLYGVNGVADRLFLSGNPEYQNWDFYSQQHDPTYFPDTGYSVIGSSKSAIKGYAKIDSYLATFKDEYNDGQAAFIRYGDLIQNEYTNLSEPVFRLKNVLQGNGVITPYAFGYIQTEPLFLTRLGIFAITPQDLTGKEYSQSRSFYLDGELEKETNLEDAVAIVYRDQYILAISNRLYILDGLQATRTDRSEPYSTRQYAGFLCTNVPAYTMWVDEDALFIGTKDGRVCRFDKDIEDLESYNDDGQPIYCCWETPDLDGALFYKNKTFRYFAIRMMNSLRTSVKLYTRKLASWTFVKEDRASGLYFSFEHIDFELFSFSPDTSEKVVHTKIRLKKVDKARFRVVNQRINEPFGLTNLALEYIESGNYKG